MVLPEVSLPPQAPEDLAWKIPHLCGWCASVLIPHPPVPGTPPLLSGLSRLSRGAGGNTGNAQKFYHGSLTLMNSFFFN